MRAPFVSGSGSPQTLAEGQDTRRHVAGLEGVGVVGVDERPEGGRVLAKPKRGLSWLGPLWLIF